MRQKTLHMAMAAVAAIMAVAILALPAQATPDPPAVAQLVNPAVGSPNIGLTQPFQWTTAPGASMYYFTVGTTAGNGNVFGAFVAPPQTTLALPRLPTGVTLWARVWTETANPGWDHGPDASFTITHLP